MAMIAGTVSSRDREIRRYSPETSGSWSQHRGKKTRSELEVLAQRYGWKQRPDLVLADIHDMTPDELQWRETFDKDNLANGFNSNARKADAEKKRVQEHWESLAGKDATPEGYAAANAFCKRYPQYVRSYEENNVKLSKWMYEQHLDPTQSESYEKAFRALSDTELLLSPSAIGGSGPDVFGANKSPMRDELLKAESQRKQEKRIAEQKRIDGLTSDQWKAENKHAWLDVDGVPNDLKKLDDNTRGAVFGRMGHIYAEFMAQEPRWTDTQSNRKALLQYVTANHFNYSVPELNRAFLEMSTKSLVTVAEPDFDKTAFRYEISKMSSDEYNRRRQTDRAFV